MGVMDTAKYACSTVSLTLIEVNGESCAYVWTSIQIIDRRLPGTPMGWDARRKDFAVQKSIDYGHLSIYYCLTRQVGEPLFSTCMQVPKG